MSSPPAEYSSFLQRLKGYERLESFPRSRGPEKLKGVLFLAGALNHPENHGSVIHVAGTNGKGMTAAMIGRLLIGAGKSMGLFTSPHVADIRERIQINGRLIDEADFARSGRRVLDLADTARERHHFSYFDLMTLIALDAFRQAALEYSVLEVGLGGLSDATNIAPKQLAVITRIGLDHLHILGNTLQEIAGQKLGIVQAGVPTVLAGQPEALRPWLKQRLHDLDSPLLSAADYRLDIEGDPPDCISLAGSGEAGIALKVTADPDRITRPRLACAATALKAADYLLGAATEEQLPKRVAAALETDLPGRLELRRQVFLLEQPEIVFNAVVLDGGHNADALTALVEQLAHWEIYDYALLLSLQSDKLVEALTGPLAGLLGGARRVITLAPQTVRAPATESLHAYLRPLLPSSGKAPSIEVAEDVRAALTLAAQQPAVPLVVSGSLWMVGDVIKLLRPVRPAGM